MRRRINLSLTILAVLMFACLFASIGYTAGHDGDNLTSSLWAKAVLEVPGSPVTLFWKSVGADIIPSGDQVISGYFYADPDYFAYGSRYNPEVFVKIYIAANGWANIAFNHVTVDPVTVHSAHHYAGSAMQTGTTTLVNRLVEHQYNGVAIDTTLQSTGGSTAASSDAGYTMASDLWARALLLPDTGPVNLIWKLLGADTTPSGASVISGYFYASPDEFAYGSAYNPELFVKIYIAANGWANIAFNHVTVDHVDISSVHQHTGRIDQARLDNRLVEHQYDYSSPVDSKLVTISGTVDDGRGNTGFRRVKYRCSFLDQNGVQRQAANTDLTNKFILSVPINMQGTVSCTPLDLPNLTLSTIASTLVSVPGDIISDENVNPASTVVAQIIESESWVDPIIRKKALLASIEREQDPYLNMMVYIATRMYANMRKRNLNVKFSGFGGGEGGGGDGGGVGGGAGDGGDASPIPNASCEFIVSNDLRKGRVLYYPALADFMDDGMLNRSDLSEIAEDMESVVDDYSPEEIQAAFNRYFKNGLGEPCSAAADEDGEYFIETPPNVSGFVRCLPPNQEKLVLATYVPGRQENESLLDEDVNPATTFFSHHIASQVSGDLEKAKENFLTDTAGLGDIHIKIEGDTVTGFGLEPGSDPADEDAGLVAFSATSLFNVLYKNNVNADFLSLLDDLVENKSVAPESLEQRGVPADRAVAWSTLVNVSNDNVGSELGTDLESALSKSHITVTVTDTPGGEGITGATVEILDLPEGINCDNCDPGAYPHRLSTTENGIAAFTLSGVPPEPTTITFLVSGVPGYDETTATTRVVASASVGLEIPMTSFYALTVQGGGNGEGTVTGGDIDCSIVGTAGDGTCRADIGSGQSVTLTAAAAVGSTFTDWSGDCSGTSPTCTVTADQALTVTATFTASDVEGPQVTITWPTSASTYSTGIPTLSIGGTAADNGGVVTQVTWSSSTGGSGVCSGTDAWSVSGISLTEGDNVITVTATDAADNTSTVTLTVTYILGTSPPSVTITLPTSSPSYITNNATVGISGTASDNGSVSRVTWTNSLGGSGTCTGTTSWSTGSIALSPGSNLVTITAEDADGNTGTDVLAITYSIDEAPVVTISSPTTASTYDTKSATLSIGGTASDDVAVTQVTWVNDRGGSGTCSGTTAWNAGGIALSPGNNLITVTAEDAAGNSGTDTLTVTFNEIVSPTVTISTPTSGTTYSTGNPTLTIGGTAGDNVGVTLVTWSNDQGGNGTCSGTDSWSASGIALFEGDNVITVTAEDAAGNTGTDTLTVTFNDTDPPTATITSPTSGSAHTTNSATFSIGGTAGDNVGVTLVTWSNDQGGSGTCNGTSSWSASGIALSEGDNFITVTAEDAAGNTGIDTLMVTYISVTSPPTVTITSPTSGSTYTATSATLTIGGTATDNVGVTRVTWSNSLGGNGTCSGTTSWSTGSIALSLGNNFITVTAEDADGNTGTDTLTVTLPDIVPPTVTITSPTSGSTYTATSGTLTIGGTAADNVGVTQVTWSNNRGGNGTCSGTTSWSAGGIALYLGNNVITVTARDAAGKTGIDTLTVTLPDIVPPTVTITSPTSGSTYTATSGTLTIGGTASDNVGVTQVTWSNNRGGNGTCSGTTSWSAGGIALYLGNNVITVTARDAAGKTGIDTLTVTLPDIVPPTVTITSPTSGSTYTATSGTLTIGGTAADNVGVTQVTWSNNRGGNGTCSGTTSWSAGGIALYLGNNVITVTARDAAGKTGIDTLTVTLPDIVPPTVTITSPTSGSTYTATSGTLTIGGTASDNVGVTQVTWSNNRGGNGTCSGTTSWSAGGIALYLGNNVITVTARDAAGKTGIDTLTVTLPDIVPPTVTITSPTSGSTYTATSGTLTIGGTASDNVGVTQVTWSNNRGGNGTCSGTTSWSANGINLIPGAVNVITITAVDAVGNPGMDSLSVTYIPDVNPPTVTITSPTTKPTYITTTTPLSIGGTASDDIGVTSVTWSNNRGGSGTCSGTTSWSKTGITLYSGYNEITVTAWDAAGHSTTDTLTVLYDITGPTISFTSPTSASTYTTGSSTLSIGGWASDNVEVRLVSWSNNRGGSGTCSGTTSWGASGITLYPGSNVITVTALDAANNTGTDMLTVTYVLPAPVQIAPPNGTVFSHYPRTTTLRWQTVTGAASYTVECEIYSGGAWYPFYNFTGIKDNLYTFNFVGAQPGRWRVRAVDPGGNSGAVSGWWVFEYTR